MPNTIIGTQLAVDPALVMDANYKFNNSDRRKIDDQIRAIEQHIVDNLINGKHASWFDLSGASDAVIAGDAVCLASIAGGLVTKALASPLDDAKSVLGVVVQAAPPGGKVLVAIGGIIPPSITGIGSLAGFVRVNTTTSRCERVDTIGTDDFGIGTVDDAGWIHMIPALSSSGVGSVNVADDIVKHSGSDIDTVAGFNGIPIAGTRGTTPRIGGAYEYNEQDSDSFKLTKPVVWNPNHYGCVGDGTTDDTANLQALFELAAATPGSTLDQGVSARVIQFPNDAVYKCDGRLSLDGFQGLVLKGPAKIHFTGTGSEPFFKILSCAFMAFEDIHFTYESNAFSGAIVETGHGVSLSDVTSLTFDRCYFYGTTDGIGYHHAAAGLSLKNCIDIRVRDCGFTATLIGIDGYKLDVGFANTVLVEGCTFNKLGDGVPTPRVGDVPGDPMGCGGIHNPGEAWTIINNTFEPLQGAGYTEVSCNAIFQDLTYPCWTPFIAGNWIGDGDNSGPWITLKTLGGLIAGNLISGGSGFDAIRLGGCDGLHITGNRITGNIRFQLDDDGHYNAGVLITSNSMQSSDPYKDLIYAGSPTWLGNSDDKGNVIGNSITLTAYECTYTRLVMRSGLTWDPGTVTAGGYAISDAIGVTSAQLGQALSVGFSPAPPDGVLVTAAMVADGQAKVTVWNMSGTDWTPGTLTMRFHGAS